MLRANNVIGVSVVSILIGKCTGDLVVKNTRSNEVTATRSRRILAPSSPTRPLYPADDS